MTAPKAPQPVLTGWCSPDTQARLPDDATRRAHHERCQRLATGRCPCPCHQPGVIYGTNTAPTPQETAQALAAVHDWSHPDADPLADMHRLGEDSRTRHHTTGNQDDNHPTPGPGGPGAIDPSRPSLLDALRLTIDAERQARRERATADRVALVCTRAPGGVSQADLGAVQQFADYLSGRTYVSLGCLADAPQLCRPATDGRACAHPRHQETPDV